MYNLPIEVQNLLKEFYNLGFVGYVVGGAVRDIILGKEPKDFDIITTAPLDKLSFGKTYDIGKQKDFDIVNLKYNEFTFEVQYFDGILLKNLKQRDFRINSLVMDIHGNVYDFINGMKDIKNKIIGNYQIEEKYKKDPLRMLRAIRQAVNLDFEIENIEKIIELKHLIHEVSEERIKDELFKMANNNGKRFAKCIKLMDQTGLLEEVLPIVYILKFFGERKDFHPESYDSEGNSSVFNHVIKALECYSGNDPLVNFGILFHDVGKALTYNLRENGKPSYHNHEKAGLDVIKKYMKEMKFSNDDIDTVLYLTENHMKIHRSVSRPGKILKLVNHKDWNRLKELTFCDDSCRGPEIFDSESFFGSIERVESVALSWNEKNKVEKVVSGNLVMNILNIKPSPLVGKILADVTDWIIENDVKEEHEIINYLLENRKKWLTE